MDLKRVAAVVLCTLAALNSAPAQTILRVDSRSAATPPDGTSWTKAYPTLSGALKAVPAGVSTQIWVAATPQPYVPDSTGLSDPRDATFALASKLGIYGGFLGLAPGGNETLLTQRDPVAHETVLSGDFLRDDTGGLDDPARANNAYHVVKAISVNSTGILNGFTITGGQASGTSGGDRDLGGGCYVLYGAPLICKCKISGNVATGKQYSGGGGVYLAGATTQLTDCTITGNRAELGGGLYTFLNTAELRGCTFSDNVSRCATYGGGGLYIGSGGALTIDNCTITGNQASHEGGGVYAYDSTVTITNSSFTSNSSLDSGGGMCASWLRSGSSLSNCSFSQNSGAYGGGMYAGASGLTFSACTFTSNTASYGAGLFNASAASMTDCNFRANVSSYSGGGLYLSGAAPLTRCIFIGNTALYGGGASIDAIETSIFDCQFSSNSVTNYGGGVYAMSGSIPHFSRCWFGANRGRWGGAIYSTAASTTCDACVFTGHSASTAGGAIYNASSSTRLAGCLLAGNESNYGGAIYNYKLAPSVINCTVVDNTAHVLGGGVYNSLTTPSITNTILWGNHVDGMSTDTQIYVSSDSTPVITYTAIEDSDPDDAVIPFGGAANQNIDDNPLFRAPLPGTWTTAATFDASSGQTTFTNSGAGLIPDALTGSILVPSTTSTLAALITANSSTQITVLGDFASVGSMGTAYMVKSFRLPNRSPCVDSGLNSALPAGSDTDLDGSTRIKNAVVDRGAYETLRADIDGDRDVDALDVQSLLTCRSGSMIPALPGCLGQDLDRDQDVDMDDFGILQRCYAGSDAPPDSTCGD